MPFNGTGTYNLPDPPLVSGEFVSASEHNTTRNDAATAFTNCVTRDGQSPPVNNLPMGLFKHTNVGSATSGTDYLRADQSVANEPSFLQFVSGSNVITATLSIPFSGYSVGQSFSFKCVAANTGPVTLNVNAIGAVQILIDVVNPVPAAFFELDRIYTVTFDGANFQLDLMNTVGTAIYTEDFSGTGVQTVFTLIHTVSAPDYVDVFISGVYQNKSTFTASGTTLTFVTAPALGTNNIEVRIYANLQIESTAANNVTYQFPAAGSAVRTVNAKLSEYLSFEDYPGDMQAAIDAAEDEELGEVRATTKEYNLPSVGLFVPANVGILGKNRMKTIFNYAGSGIAINLGGNISGARKSGIFLRNCVIVTTDKNASSIRLMETEGAIVDNIYIEHPIVSLRTGIAVIVDGGNASSFFNDIRNINANHVHIGVKIISTGSMQATNNHFTNVNVFGDVSTDPTSVGYWVDGSVIDGNGTSSMFWGGNLENCGTGIYLPNGSGRSKFFGTRFEGNTKDIDIGELTSPMVFIGCDSIPQSKIFNGAGTGFNKHTFFGLGDSNDADTKTPYNKIPGTNNFISNGVSDYPLTIDMYPTQDAFPLRIRNSAATELFSIDSGGQMYKERFNSSASSPVGLFTPTFIGQEYFQSGANKWWKSVGLGINNWVALN